MKIRKTLKQQQKCRLINLFSLNNPPVLGKAENLCKKNKKITKDREFNNSTGKKVPSTHTHTHRI